MHLLDWAVFAIYAGVLLWIGLRATAPDDSAEELTLAHRSMPGWAVLCSMIATELSAATFIGVPQAAFIGDWSFLQLAVGALLAKALLARSLIPLYHDLGVTTVYQLFAGPGGAPTQRVVAATFVAGRVLASGARLFIAAQAVAVLADVSSGWAIVLTGGLAGAYTVRGGIRAVIRTDVWQGATFLAAVVALLVGLFVWLDLDVGAFWAWGEAEGRLRVVHAAPLFSLSDPRAFGTAVFGAFALTLATHGTDQDMVQRLLTARDGRSGGRALLRSGWLNFPITALFLAVGSALAYAAHLGLLPEITASERLIPTVAHDALPAGLRAMVFVGLFAAAMSSLDSAICALATTWVTDVAPRSGEIHAERRIRRASASFTIALMAAAWGMSAYWEAVQALPRDAGPPLDLVQFALSAMSIVYGGLLGVFVVAWLRPGRGHATATLAGLCAGGLLGALLFLQPIVLERTYLAWPWWIPCSAVLAAGIAAAGGRRAGRARESL